MRALAVVLLLAAAYAVCGDRICETAEVGSCRDCAMTSPNYVCDSFPDDLQQHDPDCNTTAGQDCYNATFNYSNGRGSSCYPGRCEEGTGCTTACSSNDDCSSGFCVGTCQEICDGCNSTSVNYEVYPLSTTIYLGDPTFVSFRVNRNSGSSLIPVSANGPCSLDYDQTIDLSRGYNIAIVRIDGCQFSGLASVNFTANDEAWGVVHFLSYPSLLYSAGEMPRGTVGFSSMSGKVGSLPMEVKTWVS